MDKKNSFGFGFGRLLQLKITKEKLLHKVVLFITYKTFQICMQVHGISLFMYVNLCICIFILFVKKKDEW